MRGRPDDEDRTRVALVDPIVGTVIAKHYRIELGIAAGGFGAIYRALDLRSERDVAIKLLHPNLTQSPAVVARFRREGEALQQLHDPHTVTALEVGETEDGTLYIVMELLQGENLYETFKQLGPLPWRRVVAIARAVCSSLSEAHALGIVHRDLKPANIHLEEHDSVKVLDFGIAKIIRGETGIDASDLTQAGHMIGTFDYMPPEQMVGGECTGQTDLFTLGVVMYEMITGVRPFGDHESATAMLAALLSRTPKPLGAFAEVPPELNRIVLHCLGRKFEQRYPTIDELAIDLDTLLVVEEDSTRIAPVSSEDGLAAATEIMAAQHEVISIAPDDILTPVGPGDDDVAVTPQSSLEDIAITTPISTFDDVLLTPIPPEDGATEFTPPPIFEEPEVTEPNVQLKKKKFIATSTLPGIIAPKKKS
jgi:eukaryotic-like serine/threonine-protein kinase